MISWPALGLLVGQGGLHLWGRSEWGRLILPDERVHQREAARFASLFAPQIDDALAAWLAGFGRAVVFAAAPPPELLANLRGAVPLVWEIATRPRPGVLSHAGGMQVEQLRGLGLDGEAECPAIRLQNPAQSSGVILAPGSGGRDKRLSPELGGLLARRLTDEHGEITLLLGPAEDDQYADSLLAALANTPHRLVRSPSIPDLACLLAGAELYLGADSGVTHLAAASGAPCLAVFQATSPMVWAPRGPRVRILGAMEAPHVGLAPPRPQV
ncbi:MAG: hypothetical protein K9K66_00365 [Desulfarculaceae bacterium]|nr:hypothetical protein [Desulfarculaceae bacterium]MCF8072164.1 hypothetical protein [Desulfarculaceae bacterium]MCF8100085.1 hypothetical protein [Desulfarculaceae bacterium]MCF8117940.1 hypothetical protein [Desulfarculaceae bacterium]